MRLIVLALLALLVALPATAAAKPPDRAELRRLGVAVTWPISGSEAVVRAGEYLSVEVRSRRRLVRVSLTHADGTVVARRRLKRGTFRARLPVTGGRYRLGLDVAGREYSTLIESVLPNCRPAGRDEAALRLSATRARSGDTLTVTVINTGTTCIETGRRYVVERRREDGTWEQAAPESPHRAALWRVAPNTTWEQRVTLPNLQPGRHRIVKSVTAPGGPLTVTAELDVVG